MNKSGRIERTAARLLEARLGGLVSVEELEPAPANRAEAYRVQAVIARHMGAVGAFKAGRRSPDEQPLMAPIFAVAVRHSPARFVPNELHLIGIELEIAFLVHRPLPDVESADFALRARACVSPLAAIEVVDTRLADYEAAGPLWQLADNQNNGGLVVGEPIGDWHGRDLATIDARLEIDGQSIFDGPATVPGGDAYDTFCAFARRVGQHCGGLAVGHYVTTGSITGLVFTEWGRRVTGRLAGLGDVVVDFATQ